MVDIQDIKLPPNSQEAEKGVISSIILDNDSLYSATSYFINAEDFYQKEHQFIYEAISQLWESNKTIDVITISDQLSKNGNLENIGGIDYLYELSSFVLTPTVVGEYSKIVKEKSILRNILKTSQKIAGDVYEEKDTGQILDNIEKRIFDLTQINTSSSLAHIKDILNQRMEEYMEIVDDPSKVDKGKVLSTYSHLDNLLGGFKPGDLVILAARPSMGKTSFAINLLINAAIKQNKYVAMFSLEMGNDQIVDRILSCVSETPLGKIHRGDLHEEDFANIGEAMEKLSEVNIFLDDKGGATIPELKSKLRRLKIEKGGLDLILIDYLQLMSGASSKFAGNRVQEISEISRGLKELARELEVPILALSQLSRAVEQRPDKKPQLSDLRESGAIEQDADAVLMLFREDYYDPDTDRKGLADVFLRKNRNGPVGDVELVFVDNVMKFYDKAEEESGYLE
ncbi:replicative DNA helicase [Candidatus Absconditicoccus praedator]|uniref:replicative DNA helicase n=1 Tax=Candidatus Absconditicoccus praedator TaxID=2735562 RepID=UPI001E586287|nr:replicative DNA helicase [Candidatus Absconditicoccus praedator]UFX83482.1 replicative DNA helicase [Candidatus Absconditicoccus praedator]